MGEIQKKQVEKAIEEKDSKIVRLEKQAKEFREKNPEMDFTIMTKRPEGMDYELYKFLRKLSNKAVRNYIRRGR